MKFIPEHLREFVTIKQKKVDIGEIYTFFVLPTSIDAKKKSLRLDDYTYANYPELVELIPRGFSILFDLKGNEICRLNGLKKFDGTCALDNDCDTKTNLINYEEIKKWEKEELLQVIFEHKANGKMVVFKIFDYNEKTYIFGGSKNVHDLHIFNEPIIGDQLADKILQKVQLDCHQNYIKKNKTIIAEYVDGRHIVYTESPYIEYFDSIKHILPTQNTLPTQEQFDYLRSLKNIEGVVVVYKNIKTNKIYRQKHKTIWYILIRVIREKCQSVKSKENTESLFKNIIRTIYKRSEDFLHLSQKELDEYDFTIADVPVLQKETKTELFNYGKKCLEFGLKVCFILRGVSGCGKSTFANEVLNKFKSGKTFSTDSYFMENGIYKFDYKKLKQNHNQNFIDFQKCTDDIIFVDNTNLTLFEYSKYINYSINKGYITLVLTFHESKNILVERTLHVDATIIDSMILKINSHLVLPQYYGLFIGNEHSIGQTKPLHITCAIKKNQEYYDKHKHMFGNVIFMNVIGKSKNDAGECLIIDIESITPYYDQKNTPHITISTNKNYKPVQVGEMIMDNNTHIHNSISFKLKAIYGPIY